jgi:hypothetical protein
MNDFLTNEEPRKQDKEIIYWVGTLGNLRVSYNQRCLITILRHIQIINVMHRLHETHLLHYFSVCLLYSCACTLVKATPLIFGFLYQISINKISNNKLYNMFNVTMCCILMILKLFSFNK